MRSISKRWAFGLAGLSAGLFVIHSLTARAQWEKDRTVEICVDGSEIELLTDQNDGDTWTMLENLRTAGVSTVAIYWDPTQRLSDLMGEWRSRVPEGMRLTLRPEPVPFSDWSKGWPRAARPLKEGPRIQNVLFSGEAVMGYPDLTFVKEWLAPTDYHLPWVEFGRQRGMASLRQIFPERIVRAHSFSEDEMPQASRTAVSRRLCRAVRERGARFLYVRFFPGLSRAQNEAFVVELAQSLRRQGYVLGLASPRYAEWPTPRAPLSPRLRVGVALVVSVSLPLLAFFWSLRQRSPVLSLRPDHGRSSLFGWEARGGPDAGPPPAPALAPLALGGAGVATGLLVAALLADPSFTLGFSLFRGVKLALLLPLGVALFSLYRGDEIRHIFYENVTVGRLLLGGLVLGGVAYFVLRIGHGTVADASAMELAFRGKLESFLGVRPRFKEFMIGHPCLWVGFYLRHRLHPTASFLPAGRSALAQALRFIFHDSRPFLLVGFIGPLSIVNTFCHAHTPLGVSLIRTFHGLWMGAVVGGLLIAGLKWAEVRWQKIR